LARRSRFFLKKRGNRRTGSADAARVSEAALSFGMLAVGAAGLWAVLSWWIVPHWQADYDFIKTTGTIVDARIEETQVTALDKPQYRARFRVEYEFDGVERRVWTLNASNDYSRDRAAESELLEKYVVGEQYPVWFAPRDPDRVVLQRGGNWWIWLLVVIPIPFITIGAGGLVYTIMNWRTSSERRAASLRPKTIAPKTIASDATGTSDASDAENQDPDAERASQIVLAAIPLAENMTNSPGTHLAYRLPMSSESSWRLLGAVAFCVLSAGITTICIWLAVAAHVRGNADWLLDVSILPLLGVTAWAVSLVARQWTISNAVGPTMVEIADHPLFPGETCELLVLQSGRLAVNWLEVNLICIELASYQQGTDVRSESAIAWRERVLRCERFRIDDDQPFQRKCLVTIPVAAMHSVSCPSNEIRWNIVVRGEAEGWPEFERSFPIVVFPPRTPALAKRRAAVRVNGQAIAAATNGLAVTTQGDPAAKGDAA
jgi:hypothetical protein